MRPFATLVVRVVDAETERTLESTPGLLFSFGRNTRPPRYARTWPPGGASRLGRPDGQRIYYAARNGGVDGDTRTGEVSFSLEGAYRYALEKTPVTVVFGETTHATIRLRPAEAVARKNVLFEAYLPGGKPFAGALSIRMRSGRRTRGVGANFDGGIATSLVPIAAGSYRFEPRGAGSDPRLFGWIRAGPPVDAVVAHGPGPCVVRFQLVGAPYTLTVRDREGKRVRGYWVYVRVGREDRTSARWDIRSQAVHGSEEAPHLWLPAGKTAVYVRVPGVGRGGRVEEVPGDGVRRHLELVLSEPVAPRRRGPFVPP